MRKFENIGYKYKREPAQRVKGYAPQCGFKSAFLPDAAMVL